MKDIRALDERSIRALVQYCTRMAVRARSYPGTGDAHYRRAHTRKEPMSANKMTKHYVFQLLHVVLALSIYSWSIQVNAFSASGSFRSSFFQIKHHDVAHPKIMKRYRPTTMLKDTSSDEDMNDVDVDWLVMSLSREQDDDVRREKLAELFQSRGLEEGFAVKFEKSVESVGTKVQQSARENAGACESSISSDGENNGGDSSENSKGSVEYVTEYTDDGKSVKLPERTDEELQLWALVDMMVQSKVVLKKMSGK